MIQAFLEFPLAWLVSQIAEALTSLSQFLVLHLWPFEIPETQCCPHASQLAPIAAA
jgi:hypothetical protein